ncbi:MAG: ATP-binding protein [Planctomycetota bacterium]
MFDRNSIKTQIYFLVVGAVSATVLIALAFVCRNTYLEKRNARIREASSIADLLAENLTAAVSFDDPQSAEALMKSLEISPTIRGAVILNPDEEIFASYGSCQIKDSDRRKFLYEKRTHSEDGVLTVAARIIEDGEFLGVFLTQSDTSDIWISFCEFFGRVLVVFIFVMGVVLQFSSRVLHSIISPVLELTNVASYVSQSKDYSRRASTARGEVGTLCEQFNEMLGRIEAANTELTSAKEALAQSNATLEQRVEERTLALESAHSQISRELEAKEAAYTELESLQSQLVESSRAATMAEIANGVLHNIGNCLNSVNISAGVAEDRIFGLPLDRLAKTASFLTEKQESLGENWTEFNGIHAVPKMLAELNKNIEMNRTEALVELRELAEHVQFIKEIVESQQSHARQPGLLQSVVPSEIFDVSLKLVNSHKNRGLGVEITKEYDFNDPLPMDKHRVSQILSNFIKNGFEAMADTEPVDRKMQLQVERVEDNVLFRVRDYGHGIDNETIDRLFTYGFTTKQTGHGFGLHSAACAAKEMHGRVFVESDGIGSGSTFTLELPISGTKERDEAELCVADAEA